VIRVEVNDSSGRQGIDRERLAEAVRAVLAGEGIAAGEVSLAIVDANTMHALNRRHLEHDYPTDVLSFLLERDGESLEGEIIVSVDEAALNAPKFGSTPEDELALYAIHGALHLCGYDDLSDDVALVMRERESYWLSRLGLPVSARGPVAAVASTERLP
jgi:probable rRNA maturation factor